MNWSDFHFLRPFWLLLLPFTAALYFLPATFVKIRSMWAKVIAPHLLPHVLIDVRRKKPMRWHRLVMPIFASLLVLAISGPTIKRRPSDVSFKKAPIIVCLEVSEAMLARDIEPSRLKRAIFKLEDLFKKYAGAEIALIAFAGDAHVVVPLTEDYNTILSLVKTLSPDMMPLKGVNIGTAVLKAQSVAARIPQARVVVMTSTQIDDKAQVSRIIKDAGLPMTIWAFATEMGAPSQNQYGQFDRQGNSVTIAKLDRAWLSHMSNDNSNIAILTVTPDDNDVRGLVKSMESSEASRSKKDRYFDAWYDLGPYVLLIAITVFIVGFFFARERLWLVSILLIFQGGEIRAFSFSDWFLRPEQRAQRALLQGDFTKAADLFEDDLRKGLAYFRAKDYDRAIEHLSKVDSADGLYNLGNAYAHKGDFSQAIKSYGEALKRDSKNADAQFNKELLEKQMKEQEQQNQNQDQNQEKSDKEQKEQQQNHPDKKEASPSQSSKDEHSNNQQAEKNQPKPESDKVENKSSPQEQQQQNPPHQNEEQKAVKKPSDKQALDKETQYFFNKLEQRNSLYLKRKFRYETEKVRSGG